MSSHDLAHIVIDLRETLKSVGMDLESVVVAGYKDNVGVITVIRLAYLWWIDFWCSVRAGCGLLRHGCFDSPWLGSLGHDWQYV